LLTSIVAPHQRTTTLAPDGNGNLATITDPAGERFDMTYSDTGLMVQFQDPRRWVHSFTYDSNGRLNVDADPAGGAQTLTEPSGSQPAGGWLVQRQTAEQTVTKWSTATDASGVEHHVTTFPTGHTTTTLDDVSTRKWRREAVRDDASSPWRWVYTSPQGRIVTAYLDANGRVTKEEIAGITYPVRYEYDTLGRLQYVKQGTQGTDERIYQLVYDGTSGFLTSIIDPTGAPMGLGHDAAGRVTSQTQAGLVTTFPRDPSGNVMWVAPPDRPAHAFSYNPVDLVTTYTPPAVAGVANPATSYGYNLDHQLTTLTRPDGAVSLTYEPSHTGRLLHVSLQRGQFTLDYDSSSGALASVNVAGGVTLGVAQDGPLPLSETWGGIVAGQTFSVSRDYDTYLQVTPLTVTDGTGATFPVTLQYDNDGLLTHAISGTNNLALTRDGNNGRVTATTLGGVGPRSSPHRLVTDAHLVRRAARNKGRLATFDGTLAARAGAALVELVPR
jgi:YD repeat-containing protein